MPNHKRRIFALFFIFATFPFSRLALGSEVIVSAAASLKDVLTRSAAQFEKANPEVKLVLNIAGSGQLRMQIENGAPVDLYISAALSDMDSLAKKGLIVRESRVTLAKNTLVLIRNRGSRVVYSKMGDLTQSRINRIAIGNPATVPVGNYAKETLENQSLFEKVSQKLIYAENVRQVLDYVSRDEADAGFVYKTDALVEAHVQIVEFIPSDFHQPIEYPAAIVASSKNKMIAAQFMNFLKSTEGVQIFKKFGFE